MCAHINTELCVQRGSKGGKKMRVWGAKEGRGGGRAGIQLTGTSFQYHLEGDYPVCTDKRGKWGEKEGQMRKRSRKIK